MVNHVTDSVFDCSFVHAVLLVRRPASAMWTVASALVQANTEAGVATSVHSASTDFRAVSRVTAMCLALGATSVMSIFASATILDNVLARYSSHLQVISCHPCCCLRTVADILDHRELRSRSGSTAIQHHLHCKSEVYEPATGYESLNESHSGLRYLRTGASMVQRQST